ncbi:MAG: class I SAM-dependent methyltransferase [Candidatus Dormibacteraeota bacterium]|uniref:Class I SAM-dependent methyltransferase n=1 Tax=Candidatus Amunia macphersoniae TaxID=3127014 RepID=A0A934KHJ0_9BACT|nr:class I SAM-dependent methyltransferase [Candidatus Dormibacteraeota bacterium]
MSAHSVLDVGCGTGQLLRRARQCGHAGRLVGLDPAPGMVNQARKWPGIEWMLGDLGSVRYDQEFELVVMTGHVFQVFLEDDELRTTLAAVRSALTDHGRFSFETRHPGARAWERWTRDKVVEDTDPAREVVRRWCEVETPVDGDLVRFTQTFASPRWDQPQLSRSTLRFLDVDAVASFLTGAGLAIERQYGDWDESPLTDTSPEIITIARRA